MVSSINETNETFGGNGPEDIFRKAFSTMGKDNDIIQGWGLYLFPNLMEIIVNKMADLIENDDDEYDCICGVHTCGLPLASMLSFKLHKPLIENLPLEIHATTGNPIHAHDLVREKGFKTAILVDSVINTGYSAHASFEVLKKAKITVKKLFVAVYHDEISPNSKSVFRAHFEDPPAGVKKNPVDIIKLWNYSELGQVYNKYKSDLL